MQGPAAANPGMMRSSWRMRWQFWRSGPNWRPTVATATLGFALIVCSVIVGLEPSPLLDERAQAIARGRRDTANLVKSLTQHAELTFRSAETVLAGVGGRRGKRGPKPPGGG